MSEEEPDLQVPADQWVLEWISEHCIPFRTDPTWPELAGKMDRAMVICVTEHDTQVMATEEAFRRALAIPPGERVWAVLPTAFLTRIMPQLEGLVGGRVEGVN